MLIESVGKAVSGKAADFLDDISPAHVSVMIAVIALVERLSISILLPGLYRWTLDFAVCLIAITLTISSSRSTLEPPKSFNTVTVSCILIFTAAYILGTSLDFSARPNRTMVMVFDADDILNQNPFFTAVYFTAMLLSCLAALYLLLGKVYPPRTHPRLFILLAMLAICWAAEIRNVGSDFSGNIDAVRFFGGLARPESFRFDVFGVLFSITYLLVLIKALKLVIKRT